MHVVTRATTLTAFRMRLRRRTWCCRAAARREARRDALHDLNLAIHGDLATVEAEWRRFEAAADCTAFQTFDWLAAWHRHIGLRARVQPAVAVGRFAGGDTAFMLPLCVAPHGPGRRLCWLGQELCDYNAPLLARDFSERVTAERFLEIWRELRLRLQQDPLFRHDWIDLEKMPPTLGAQRNPFTHLDVSLNASGAHLTQLGGDWEEFYIAKRSSATRRRDRAKRRHMSEYGDVQFATAVEAADAGRTLEILMEQKSRALARKGVDDMFARRGWREFFLDLATNPQTRQLVHVSRLQIGADTVIAGRTSRVLLLSRFRAAIQFGGERWSSGVRSERSCRPPRRRARAGRGSSPTAPIETALPGCPCASSLSHFSRQIRRQQTDPHPPPGRALRLLADVAMAGWFLYPLAVPSAAPDHARAGGHGARDQSDPLEPTGRRGGGWPNDGEVDVGGCRRFRFNH